MPASGRHYRVGMLRRISSDACCRTQSAFYTRPITQSLSRGPTTISQG